MNKNVTISVGSLKKLIRESKAKQEFKPVLGNGVEKDNKSNNGKAYKETDKKIKDFDGGVKKTTDNKLQPKKDANRTTLDYTPINEPDKAYKERVKAQAKGYTSKAEEENGIEKAAQFDNVANIYNQFKNSSDELNQQRADLAHAGLTANKLPKHKFNTLTESELPKEKILRFKKTNFLSESRMMSLIPEEYKKHGQRIHMIDKSGNEYIVESVQSKYTGAIETKVVDYINKQRLNEELERINELFNYKPNTTAGRNSASVLNEDENFRELLNLSRNSK